ncbi:uncharacterized protein V6R79_017033 [Siganus canaliculatus]
MFSLRLTVVASGGSMIDVLPLERSEFSAEDRVTDHNLQLKPTNTARIMTGTIIDCFFQFWLQLRANIMFPAKLKLHSLLSPAGRLYSVGCPGQNIRLECPEGQWMEVLSMQHGVKTSTTTCGITDQPAQVSEEKCLHFLLKPWSRFICNRMSSCRLPKPDAQMFTCGFTEDTFVQVSYRCIIRRPGSQTVVACDGQDVNLKCDDGVISVLKASYGRFDQNTCTSTPSVMTFCASSTAELHVRDLCVTHSHSNNHISISL